MASCTRCAGRYESAENGCSGPATSATMALSTAIASLDTGGSEASIVASHAIPDSHAGDHRNDDDQHENQNPYSHLNPSKKVCSRRSLPACQRSFGHACAIRAAMVQVFLIALQCSAMQCLALPRPANRCGCCPTDSRLAVKPFKKIATSSPAYRMGSIHSEVSSRQRDFRVSAPSRTYSIICPCLRRPERNRLACSQG